MVNLLPLLPLFGLIAVFMIGHNYVVRTDRQNEAIKAKWQNADWRQ